MRNALLFASVLALAACEREAASIEPPVTTASAPSTVAPTSAATNAAWLTEGAAYPLIGKTAPAFAAPLNGGGEATLQSLQSRWTILAFWGLWSDDSIADARYIQALKSAADQDPDLDFLSIHVPPSPERAGDAFGAFLSLDAWFKDQGGAWPTAMDADGAIAAAFKIDSAPVYLLIGPDLTIEGYRTDLSATPDEGVKSVIRGVAELRKQIAAPQ